MNAARLSSPNSAGPAAAEGAKRTERDAARRPHYQPLVVVVFAVAAGIVLDRYGPPRLIGANSLASWWWLIAAGCSALWWFAWRRNRESLSAALLLVSIAFTGAAWHHLNWYLFPRNDLARFASLDSAPACIEVVARDSIERVPAPRETPLRAIPGVERSRLVVEAVAIRDGTRWRPASGRCQLLVNGHVMGIQAGDRLGVVGQLARPTPPLNPGEFDFAAHARADRELTRLQSSAPECVTVTSHDALRGPADILQAVRGSGKRIVRNSVGPARAGLAGAILLGSREGLTAEETLPYLLTGTIHVLVVSGLNVAILATGLLVLMRLGVLSRRSGLALVMLVVVLYALLAESQPPVMRAAVLAVLMCVAEWIGRRGVAFNSLAAAALVVLAINPGDLFRPGPQLSFLAVATLICIGNRGGLIPSGPSDWVERMFAADRPWYVRSLVHWGRTVGWLGGPPDRLEQMIAAARPWYVRSLARCGGTIVWLIFTSLVVWLTTLPLVLNRFHVGSPIAVAISPAVWLVVFAAMWSGFVMLIVGWLIPPLGAICGATCDWSLAGLENIVQWAESLPGGHFWVPGPAWWWVVGFYLGLLAVMLRGRGADAAALARGGARGVDSCGTGASARQILDARQLRLLVRRRRPRHVRGGAVADRRDAALRRRFAWLAGLRDAIDRSLPVAPRHSAPRWHHLVARRRRPLQRRARIVGAVQRRHDLRLAVDV